MAVQPLRQAVLQKPNTGDDFYALLNDSREGTNGSAFAYFFADECAASQKLGPVFESFAEKHWKEGTLFIEVNIDKLRDITKDFKVTETPTFIRFDNGKEADRYSGFEVEPLNKLLGQGGEFNNQEAQQQQYEFAAAGQSEEGAKQVFTGGNLQPQQQYAAAKKDQFGEEKASTDYKHESQQTRGSSGTMQGQAGEALLGGANFEQQSQRFQHGHLQRTANIEEGSETALPNAYAEGFNAQLQPNREPDASYYGQQQQGNLSGHTANFAGSQEVKRNLEADNSAAAASFTTTTTTASITQPAATNFNDNVTQQRPEFGAQGIALVPQQDDASELLRREQLLRQQYDFDDLVKKEEQAAGGQQGQGQQFRRQGDRFLAQQQVDIQKYGQPVGEQRQPLFGQPQKGGQDEDKDEGNEGGDEEEDDEEDQQQEQAQQSKPDRDSQRMSTNRGALYQQNLVSAKENDLTLPEDFHLLSEQQQAIIRARQKSNDLECLPSHEKQD